MLKRMKQLLKDEGGQITITEVIILIAIITLVASLFGEGLQGVFTGEDGKGGVVKKLNDFVSTKFDAVIESNTTSN